MRALEALFLGIVLVCLAAIALPAISNPGKLATAMKYLQTGHTSSTSVVGGPSLSAQRIDAILSKSPAYGTGQTFYSDSIRYNIDDAYAVGFFKHESSLGLYGAASVTHSIGNIVCTVGYSCIGRFRYYASWQAGIHDWYQLISGPAYVGSGLKTLEQIIPKYAPSSENSPADYIAAVERDVTSWRQGA